MKIEVISVAALIEGAEMLVTVAISDGEGRSEKRKFLLFTEQYLEFGVHKGGVIDAECFDRLEQLSRECKAIKKGSDLLSYSASSRVRLAQRLRSKGIDKESAENTAEYLNKLNALDADFQAMFDSVEDPMLVMGDRFPFLYFANRYGFSYEAAFPSCSSASEPSPQRVIELVELVKKEKISTVFYMESGNHSVADRIAAEGGAVTALLHACHKVTPEEMQSGTTYLSLMRQNYTAIRASLGLLD